MSSFGDAEKEAKIGEEISETTDVTRKLSWKKQRGRLTE